MTRPKANQLGWRRANEVGQDPAHPAFPCSAPLGLDAVTALREPQGLGGADMRMFGLLGLFNS